METIGNRIKQARLEKGMTQQELADACGYEHRSTISKIERDAHDTTLPTIEKIAKALDVDPDYLVFGNDDEYRLEIGDINDEEKEIIKMFQKLSDHQKNAFLALLRSTAGEEH